MGKEFKDSAGRLWSPRMTARTAYRLKAECGLDIFEGVPTSQAAAVAFYCCEDVAKERGVSFDDFMDAIATEDQFKPMIESVVEAVAAFFPSQPGARKKNPVNLGDGETSMKSLDSPA